VKPPPNKEADGEFGRDEIGENQPRPDGRALIEKLEQSGVAGVVLAHASSPAHRRVRGVSHIALVGQRRTVAGDESNQLFHVFEFGQRPVQPRICAVLGNECGERSAHGSAGGMFIRYRAARVSDRPSVVMVDVISRPRIVCRLPQPDGKRRLRCTCVVFPGSGGRAGSCWSSPRSHHTPRMGGIRGSVGGGSGDLARIRPG
jgi:hypothetical protein